jgi:hypothetical protein
MDRQAPEERGIDFVDTLKQLFSRVKNGSITVTKQDGHVVQIAFSEKSTTLRTREIVETETDKGVTAISANDLKLLLEYLDRVTFGTVTVQIRNASITEIEKIEKIKI